MILLAPMENFHCDGDVCLELPSLDESLSSLEDRHFNDGGESILIALGQLI